MERYIKALRSAIPGITAEDLLVSLREPGVHILDSIILRGALENHFGLEIPDTEWKQFNTLADTLQYCDTQISRRERKKNVNKIKIHRDHEIGMPHMANSGLSENWLLKEMGDMHWDLLSRGLEQKPGEFTDANGNRLYAAFVRINYSLTPLNEFCENEKLYLTSEMKRFGTYAYYSHVNGMCNNKNLTATMMTSFLARKANDNSQISSGTLREQKNHIEEIEEAPSFHIEHRLLSKNRINEIRSGGYHFRFTDTSVETIKHQINPHFEINGVGLLYFASYPIIADRCASEFFKNTMSVKDYDKRYHTTYRDIFYFANCNANDQVIVELNSVEQVNSNTMKTVISMYRESDKKLMARVLTVKRCA